MKFVDLNAQFKTIEREVRQSIDRVLKHGRFIMGPEVQTLEWKLEEFCSVKRVISASSGTDALLMSLMACGVEPGDAIIVPSFTFISTAEVVQLLGAKIIFVDIEDHTFNIDIHQLENTVQRVKSEGKINLKGIIPVDLFGLPADYDRIKKIAEEHQLFILSDAAQSFGAKYHGKRVGQFGDLSITSFFPTKTLGCYGDGGAIFTNNEELANIVKSIRFHGQGNSKYDHVRTGISGRLDTIQAGILMCKLQILDQEIAKRQTIANIYTKELSEYVTTPKIPDGYQSSWSQYTIRLKNRDKVRHILDKKGIDSAIYYPCPLHLQPVFKNSDGAGVFMPISEQLSKEVLSLPVHPYLGFEDQMRVVNALKEAVDM